MRSAIDSRNAEALSSYIDFPTLRESLKSQAKAKLGADLVVKQWSQGHTVVLSGAAALGVADIIIDAVYTPETLKAALQNRAPGPIHGTAAIPFRIGPEPSVERIGLNSFDVPGHGDKAQIGRTHLADRFERVPHLA